MPLDRRSASDLLIDALPKKRHLESIAEPHEGAGRLLPEVQNAIRAATDAAESAIWMADVINRLLKAADDKSLRGRRSPESISSLRAGLLFASAGLDTSLKRLVRHSICDLVERDANVEAQFQKWATQRMSSGDGGVIDAKSLVQILLARGVTPRDSLLTSWVHQLTDASAQSAERVTELAQALGVTDKDLRKRISPAPKEPTSLQRAFIARNEIAHELDITDPDAETRKPLERISRYRKIDDISAWCFELLDITQLITNDVAVRLTVVA